MAAHLKEFFTDRRILFLLAMLVIYCVTSIFSADLQLVWIAACVGIVFFYIIEYIIHRFILHGYFGSWLPKAYKGHEMHHDHPNDIEYLLTPNIYNITYHIGFGSVAALVTWNIYISCAFMLGITLYQLYYEWSHFVTHRTIRPLTPWGRGMKKFHLLHHFKSSDHYFGVTNSTIDIIVGTYPSADSPIKKKTESL
jgi:4-hydroxysphinganine ceramide fatty acyl 2-hydroxylase